LRRSPVETPVEPSSHGLGFNLPTPSRDNTWRSADRANKVFGVQPVPPQPSSTKGDRDNAAETERVRRSQDRNAPRYDRQISLFERILFAGGREWVCEQAHGRVLELAVGTARNLEHYPSDVTLTGVELSQEMLEIGRRRATELAREVDLRLGDAQALEFPDDSFDTVVCTLGLCTIPDPRRAVAEAWRVLRPGGQVLLLEHVRSPLHAVRGIQRLLEPLSVRFAADHLTREPADYLRAEGFEIERLERSKWGLVERVSGRKSERATTTADAQGGAPALPWTGGESKK
jgi:ubiquinone/menaquinone biosynthesis C-methylase UbiE